MTRVHISPVPGRVVRDMHGRIVPVDGRYYNPNPFWIRAKKRGDVVIGGQEFAQDDKKEIEKVEKPAQKPKRGYYSRKEKNTT